MTDHISVEKRSENMRKIHSKDTKPEISIRKALHHLGFRYRLHDRRLPGCPDIILKKHNIIIDIRGCFWHGHNCRRGNRPKSNIDYWNAKIEYNLERDARVASELNKMGWEVLIVWECECASNQKLATVVEKIVLILRNSGQC